MGEIAELRAEGIEVDNEDPAPENMVEPPPADAAHLIGEWITPAICARKADAKIKNDEGRWKNREWSTIAEDTEFRTFRMCFFENYVVDHMLPATNKYLSTPITLQEFYVFLGCNFSWPALKESLIGRSGGRRNPVSMAKGAHFT